jgi:hypothetical protein
VARCKRRLTVRNTVIPAGGSVDVDIAQATAELTLRVVDAAGAGVAWTLAVAGAAPDFHFAAGESYTDDRLTLDEGITLTITAVAASIVELVLWEG